MTKRVDRDEVARLAGVSSATISYVINNGPRPVSPETRARVLDAIKKLGYQPNAVARNFRRQRTSTIGLILPDTENPYYAEVTRGIERVAMEQGYFVVQCHSDFSLKREVQFVDLLYTERAAGVVWVPTTESREPADKLAQYHLPTVMLDRTVPGVSTPSVVADNYRGAYLATKHLIDLGHKLIGCIGRPLDLSHSHSRIQGYRAALEEYGLPFDGGLVVRGGFRPDDGRTAGLELIGHSPRPTAIFAYNDYMAIGAMRAAYEKGLRVPDDLAIAGFDDIPQSALTCPSLTTIRQPKAELGSRAAQLILELIAGRAPETTSIMLDVELVVRESTVKQPKPDPALG